MTLRFIRPARPVESAYVGSFNGEFRDEVLNEHWVLSLADPKLVLEAWRVDYNTFRPYRSEKGRRRISPRALERARRLASARLEGDLKPADLIIRLADRFLLPFDRILRSAT
jgi:transposase InsO family protein